jgi:GH43 family beta-xylosidase
MVMKKLNLFARYSVLFLFVALNSMSCDKPNGNGGGNGGGGGGTPQPTNTFTNPLLTSGPDPWVIRKDNFYYYTHTLGNRIALWKTAKMSELKSATQQTVWTAPSTGANSRNIWAPELHFLDGKWYLYYTAGSSSDLATQRTFVLENANADPTTGTWTDKGQLADPAANFFAIDATVFTHNSSNYLIWSGQASATDNTQRLYIAKMSNLRPLIPGRYRERRRP